MSGFLRQTNEKVRCLPMSNESCDPYVHSPEYAGPNVGFLQESPDRKSSTPCSMQPLFLITSHKFRSSPQSPTSSTCVAPFVPFFLLSLPPPQHLTHIASPPLLV